MYNRKWAWSKGPRSSLACNGLLILLGTKVACCIEVIADNEFHACVPSHVHAEVVSVAGQCRHLLCELKHHHPTRAFYAYEISVISRFCVISRFLDFQIST